MNFFRRYLIVVFAGVSLLFGIQVPNFVDQYEKRVDAHLVEVTHTLRPYQEIAARHYNGSLYALIEFHKNATVKTFQEEGAAIDNMYKRKRRFEADRLALKSGFFWKVVHIMINGDRELLNETATQYSYAIPLNQDAVLSGVILAAANIMILESLFGLFGYLARRMTPRARRERKQMAVVALSRSPKEDY
jgi:hypothetical protein